MINRLRQNRLLAIQQVCGSLERDSYPRLQMLLIVMLTGAAGFVVSFLLLRAGLGDMWLRYLAAFCAAKNMGSDTIYACRCAGGAVWPAQVARCNTDRAKNGGFGF